MADKQKVIKGLECCIVRNPDDRMRCSDCPYRDPGTYCLNRLKHDALAVLMEHEEPTVTIADNGSGSYADNGALAPAT